MKTLLSLFASLFLLTSFAHSDTYVPSQLAPWTQWIQDNRSEFLCAQGTCEWPTALQLAITDSGASFNYFISVDTDSEIQIPGSRESWPIEVKAVDGNQQKPVVTINKSEQPFVVLKRGRYQLAGKFTWQEAPTLLTIPESIALISVTKNGLPLKDALGNEPGTLVIGSTNDDATSLELAVSHNVEDTVPFKITTWIAFKASGKPQVVNLKDFLPESSMPISIATTLGYQLKPGGEIAFSIPAGEHEAFIYSVFSESPQQIKFPSPQIAGWPETQSISWHPRPDIRSVDLTGADPVDQARVEMPDEWKNGQLFMATSPSEISLKENKGSASFQLPNSFSLNRRGWLTLDGKQIVAEDTLSGTINQEWRINAVPAGSLERATVNGAEQVITADPKTSEPGIEIRSHSTTVVAQRLFDTTSSKSSISGWNQDLSRVSYNLTLPPGWSLFHASDVDSVSNSWLGSWTLLELFFAILIAIVTAKFFGLGWASVALLSMVATHSTSLAPRYVWVHLLGVCGLIKILPDGGLKGYIRFHGKATVLYLGFFLLAFTIAQLMSAFFPAVPSHIYDSELIYGAYSLIETSTFGWLLLTFFVWVIIFIFQKPRGWFKTIILLCTIGAVFVGVLFVSSSLTSIFFNTSNIVGFNEGLDMRQQRAAGSEAMQEGYMSKSFMPASPVPQRMKKKADFNKPDPHAIVQSGRSLPIWNWQTVSFTWNGAVARDQQFNLYFIAPWMNMILSLLKALCVFLFAKLFFQQARSWWTAGLIIVLSFIPLNVSAQDFPPAEFLKELETRLLKDTCTENCSTINRMDIVIQDMKVSVNIDASSKGESSVTVPGPADILSVDKIEVDGQGSSAARRDENGFLVVRVSRGVHAIKVSGTIASQSLLTLQFPQVPGYTSVSAPQWKVSGVDEHGVAQSSIALTRIEHQGEKIVQDAVLPFWYVLTRTIQLGADWKIENLLRRLGNTANGSQFTVPLLEGESVVTSGIKVQGRSVVGQFDPGSDSVSWTSTFDQRDQFSLVGAHGFTEVWQLSCSPVWQCDSEGLEPSSRSSGELLYTWHPVQNQAVKVSVRKPKGLAGATKAVDSISHSINANERSLIGTIDILLQATRGGYEILTLPADATFMEGSSSAGAVVSLEQKGKYSFPVHEGKNSLRLQYSMPSSSASHLEAPSIQTESNGANITTTISMPASRWILYATGPGWGTTVLFWVKILFVVLTSFILTRTKLTPLSFFEWLLIGLSTAVLSVFEAGIIILWFIALSFREKSPPEARGYFNLYQIFLVLLTLCTAALFVEAIRSGLLFAPDMILAGGMNSSGALQWYVDYTGTTLPQPEVCSAPLWCWRVTMLIWASLLVVFITRWARWGVKSFVTGGIWKSGKIAQP